MLLISTFPMIPLNLCHFGSHMLTLFNYQFLSYQSFMNLINWHWLISWVNLAWTVCRNVTYLLVSALRKCPYLASFCLSCLSSFLIEGSWEQHHRFAMGSHPWSFLQLWSCGHDSHPLCCCVFCDAICCASFVTCFELWLDDSKV